MTDPSSFQDLSLVHTQPTLAPPGNEDRVVDEMAALQLTFGGTAATVPAPNGPTQPDLPDLDQENIDFDLANSVMFGLAQPPKRPSQRERRSNDPPARSSSTRRSGLPSPGGPLPLQRQPSSLGENRARIHRSSSASRIPVNAPLARLATGGSRSSSVDRRGQVNGSSNSFSGRSTTANRRSAQVAAPARQSPGPVRVATGGGPLTRARSRELQQRAEREREGGDADIQAEREGGDADRQAETEREGGDADRQAEREREGGDADRQAETEREGGDADRQAEREREGGDADRQAETEREGGDADRQAERVREGGDADRQTEESHPLPQNPNPPRQVEQERRGRERTRRSIGQVAGPAPIRVVAQPRGEAGGGTVAAAALTARSIDRHLNNMPRNQRAFNASVNRRRVLSRSNSGGPTSTPMNVPGASVAANPSAISPTQAVRPAAAARTRSRADSQRRPAAPTVSSTSRATRPSSGSAPRQPVTTRDSSRPRAQPGTAAAPKRRSFKSELRAYPQPTGRPPKCPHPLTVAMTPHLQTASRALPASRPAVAVGGEGGRRGSVGTSPAMAMAGAGQPANSARRVDIAALISRLMNPPRRSRSRQPEEPTQRPARGPTSGVRMQRPLPRTRSSSVASRNASAPPHPPVEAAYAEADTAAAEPDQEQSTD